MKVDDIVLFGATGAALVFTLVQLAKAWNLPDGWGQRAASIAALLVAGAWEANNVWPDAVGPYIRTAIAALLLFSASVGLYHIAQGTGTGTAAAVIIQAPEPVVPVVHPEPILPPAV